MSPKSFLYTEPIRLTRPGAKTLQVGSVGPNRARKRSVALFTRVGRSSKLLAMSYVNYLDTVCVYNCHKTGYKEMLYTRDSAPDAISTAASVSVTKPYKATWTQVADDASNSNLSFTRFHAFPRGRSLSQGSHSNTKTALGVVKFTVQSMMIQGLTRIVIKCVGTKCVPPTEPTGMMHSDRARVVIFK